MTPEKRPSEHIFKVIYVNMCPSGALHRCSFVSVCLCVSLLDTTVSCAKIAEPVEMPFGM